MKVRGIRGATTVENNDSQEILSATKRLLKEMIKANNIKEENIASVFFSMTSDLDQEFPAVAARLLGWKDAALFCTKELEIEEALAKCIRVLIHYNSDKSLAEINHIYLKKAKNLRPDLVEKE